MADARISHSPLATRQHGEERAAWPIDPARPAGRADGQTRPEAAGAGARPAPGDRLECRAADSATDLAAHFAVRNRVFVEEQALFDEGDHDDHDADPGVVHVVGLVEGTPCGAVRLYPLDRNAELWKGDRLAVLAAQRHRGLGAPLVRFAVRSAAERGGREMLAYVQLDNVRFFEKLGWRRTGEPETYVGTLHQRMRIKLPDSV